MIALSNDQRHKQLFLVQDWLSGFIALDQITELRALNFADRKAVSQFFRGDQLDRMAKAAVDFELQGAKGVYFTPNALKSHMLTSRNAARDEDVERRRWLLVDVDSKREGGCCATDEQKEFAWDVLRRCQASVEAYGLTGWKVVDSGNGYHLYIPIDLPNDDKAKEGHKALLRGLQHRCGKDGASVDPTTYNAARIMRVPGTLCRKGDHTAERPHRWAKIRSDLQPVSKAA